MIFNQSVKFNELVRGIEKELLTNTPTENPNVVIDDSRPPEDITKEKKLKNRETITKKILLNRKKEQNQLLDDHKEKL